MLPRSTLTRSPREVTKRSNDGKAAYVQVYLAGNQG